MKKLRYFAYGSNMLRSRIAERIAHLGKINRIGTYNLHGYKLAFNVSGLHPISFANIVPATPEDYVEGVLYDLNDAQIKMLDRHEAFYEKQYFILPDGNIGLVYVGHPKLTVYKFGPPLPELRYINLLLDGCAENDLRKTFNELVEFKNTKMKVRNSRHKKY